MIQKERGESSKKKIALLAIFVAVILSLLTFFFTQNVKKQLWEQSINTILETTRQGCNTLKIQLSLDFESMENTAETVMGLPEINCAQLESIMSGHSQGENASVIYLGNGRSIPAEFQMDEGVIKALGELQQEKGIIDPHISSVTGVNVFNLYTKITLKDGSVGYLVKEYEVGEIVDSFSLSFYNNSGFSYIVNTKGDVLIRAPHPNSNKTVQNLFDMLPETQNDPAVLKQFVQSLEENQTGYAVFQYQDESTVFCYVPLAMGTDWFLISIIPEEVVNAQTNQILTQSFALIGCIIFGIILLVALYILAASKANRKLRNQAEYTNHLYNTIPEAVALITVESPYRLTQLNRKGFHMLGYPEDIFLEAGQGLPLQSLVHPDDYEETLRIIQAIELNKQKGILEHRVCKRDGSYIWVAGIIEKTRDENGRPVFIAAFHDITAEKLMEEAAEREQRQERLTLVRAISNAYPVIISMNLSRDTLNFIYVKPGLMLGLGNQGSFSELFEDMLSTVHPDFLDDFKHSFSPDSLSGTLGQEKKEVALDMRQLLTDGNYHWTSTQIIYVDNPISEDKLAVLLSRRIDERRYEEEQRRQALQSALDNARAASEAKSQFLTNMSHDIRTPMNVIVGMTAIASTHLDDPERVDGYLKKISLSSKHLLSLINDILDMSKIESGKLSLREEPLNFAETAAETVELVRSQAHEKNLDLNINLGVLKNENVIGDPLHIRQVFVNIVSNAIKYTPEGGSVSVEVAQENCAHKGYQNYIFRCADSGIGMAADFLQKLFQPFERASDSTTSKITGTGLGLAITKNLVELMNGTIHVESELNKGSVFTVTLPLQVQGVQTDEIPSEWVGIHSLIVDDDQQICENAAELLESMGLRPEFVTEGAAAVERVVQAKDTPDPFRLAIIDWKMPNMDGVEVARRIRQEVGPDIPLIVLTAYDWSEIEMEAKEAGVTAFLSKPFYRSKVCYLLNELSGDKKYEPQDYLKGKPDYTGKRILLVEDNELNREIAHELIGQTGILIEEAYDGEEAVMKVSGAPAGYYNLVLMDIQMPKMDGYEATRAIRSLERADCKVLPIIAMTANAFEEDIQSALHAGMNAHLSKPIDVALLDQLLYRFLSENGEKKNL